MLSKVTRLFCFSLFAAQLALISTTSSGGGFEGKITRVLAGPTYGTKVFVSIDTASGQTGCHTNPNYNYVFDGSTASGKITLSLALSAYAAQKVVRIDGTATCTIHNGVENLQHIISK